MLVADAGFTGYASLIAVSDKNIKDRPDYVQRFVDASIEGWYSYLYGDPAPGNAMILKDNPEMTQRLIDYGRAAIKQHGILDSGDALTDGIGAMTAARWTAFHDAALSEGIYDKGLDTAKAYSLQFVNKKTGMALKQ